MKTIEMKVKAFSCEKTQVYSFALDSDGDVMVFDDVAGHYTHCHAISKSAQKKIKEAIKALSEEIAEEND